MSTKKIRSGSNHILLWFILFTVIAALLYVRFFAPSDGTERIDPDGRLLIHFIDVGQGDCTLITAPTGESILIDAGPGDFKYSVRRYLDVQHIRHLDYVVFTHPHEDHIGGGAVVVMNYKIDSILMPDITSNAATFRNLLEAIEEKDVPVTVPKPGDRYTLGEATITVLSPLREQYDSVNDTSIVLQIEYGKTAFMLTGDAGESAEADILRTYDADEYLKSDVLKTGHHGSSSSTSTAWLEAVSPSIAVISCGKDNAFGHPHGETLARLERAGVTVYRTDLDGTVVLCSDGQTVSVIRPSAK